MRRYQSAGCESGRPTGYRLRRWKKPEHSNQPDSVEEQLVPGAADGCEGGKTCLRIGSGGEGRAALSEAAIRGNSVAHRARAGVAGRYGANHLAERTDPERNAPGGR